MNIFEEIDRSLDKNNYLTNELKENIKGLVTIFHDKLPDVSLDGFNERIKTLRIFEGNRYIVTDMINYDMIKNILFINKRDLEKEDGMYVLLHGVISVITGNGINKTGEFSALSFGINDMITNYLIGDRSEING